MSSSSFKILTTKCVVKSYMFNIFVEMLHSQIWVCEIHTENAHNVHNALESKNTRNTYDSLLWLRYETFYYLFEFNVFRHEERETQFLSMLTFPSDLTTCGPRRKTTGLASSSSENRLASSKPKSQLTKTKDKIFKTKIDNIKKNPYAII